MRFFLLLTILLFWSGISDSRAALEYNLNTKLYFRHDGTISEGVMEGYSLAANDKVRLLVTLLEKKSFAAEVEGMSDNAIKDKFLTQATDVDPLNAQTDRKVLTFNRQKLNGKTIIQIRYQIKKVNEDWIESNTYVTSLFNTGMISLQYSLNIPVNLQKSLNNDINTFDLLEDQNERKTVFQNFKKQFGGIVTEVSKNIEKQLDNVLKHSGQMVISSAFADLAASKYGACNKRGFILKGEFTNKRGSALFSFNKIVREIKDEVTRVSTDEANGKKPSGARLDCLMGFYNEAKENATEYWAQRGAEEGCLVDDDIVTEPTETCTAATLNGMKESFDHLDEIDESLDDFIEDKDPIRLTCAERTQTPRVISGEVGRLAQVGNVLHKNACCDNGAQDGEAGPLYSVLVSENESFKNASPQAQYQMCLRKTVADPKKRFISNQGVKECASRVINGAVNVVVSALKSIASLFELDTWKAIGQMILHPVDTVTNLVSGLITEISNQIKSVTNCMSPYEAKMYACQKVPEVAAIVFGGGMVKKLAQALISKSSKTALGQVFSQAVSQSRAIQRVKRTASAVRRAPRQAAGKVTQSIVRTIYKSRTIKRSARAMGKLRDGFAAKVRAPLKDAVVARMKALKARGVVIQTRVADSIQTGRNRLASEDRAVRMSDAESAAARNGAIDAHPQADGSFKVNEPSTRITLQSNRSQVDRNAQPVIINETRNPTLITNQRSVAPAITRVDTPPAVTAAPEFRSTHLNDLEQFRSARAAGNTEVADSVQRSMLERMGALDETLGVEAGNKVRLEIAESITGKRYLYAKGERTPDGELAPEGTPNPAGELILKAHNEGGDRVFKIPGRNNENSYTANDLLAKNRRLEEAGITDPGTRRMLMESGVTGNAPRLSAEEAFQEARLSAMKGRDLVGKMRDGGQVTIDQVRLSYKDAAVGFETEARRLNDAQFVGEAWRLYTKAGDSENALRLMGVGVKRFGMNPNSLVDAIDKRVLAIGETSNPAMILERKTLQNLRVAVNQKINSSAGAPAPVASAVKPAPVAPPQTAKIEAPDISTISPAKAQAIANDLRLGVNGKPRDLAASSRYYYRAADNAIEQEVSRFNKSSNGGSQFLDNRNLAGAFDQSLASDGQVAIRILDEIYNKSRYGNLKSYEGLNAFLLENANRLNTPSKDAIVRANRRKLIEHIQEKYKNDLFDPQRNYLRSWSSAASDEGW